MSYSPTLQHIIAYLSLLGYNQTGKTMKKINIRRIYYLVRHKYLTVNNGVIVVALIIATTWVSGSLGVMQRNYDLQKELNYKQRELQLVQLETRRLELENRYYNTREYQELALRSTLGLVLPGESVLILPPNSAAAKASDQKLQAVIAPLDQEQGNFDQWMDFLFKGGYPTI